MPTFLHRSHGPALPSSQSAGYAPINLIQSAYQYVKRRAALVHDPAGNEEKQGPRESNSEILLGPGCILSKDSMSTPRLYRKQQWKRKRTLHAACTRSLWRNSPPILGAPWACKSQVPRMYHHCSSCRRATSTHGVEQAVQKVEAFFSTYTAAAAPLFFLLAGAHRHA